MCRWDCEKVPPIPFVYATLVEMNVERYQYRFSCARKHSYYEMEKKEINITEVCFSFSASMEEMEEVYVTSELLLSEIPWKLKVSAHSDGDEKIIKASLICSPPSNPRNLDWTCEAIAEISLQSFVPNQQVTRESNLPKIEFSENHLFSEPVEVIKCTDLTPFEMNYQFHFVVKLSANPVQYHTLSEMDQTRVIFQFNVEKISELETKYSPEISVRGTTWYVFLQRPRNDQESLSVQLHFETYAQNAKWSWKANCILKLLSFDGNNKPIVNKLTDTFHFGCSGRGYSKFIDWNTLMDPEKKYVKNDRAAFEIDLEVEPPKPIRDIIHKPPKMTLPDCSICLQRFIGHDPAVTKCGHIFCDVCIRRSIEEYGKCPLCNADASTSDIRAIYF